MNLSRSHEPFAAPSINRVLKKAFSSIGYANSNLVNQISSALATIGQKMGELRNGFDAVNIGFKLRPPPIFFDDVF
jgi:hypothetical protein